MDDMKKLSQIALEFPLSHGSIARCQMACGGITGLHPSGKWSTWSPGRFIIPETDEELSQLGQNASFRIRKTGRSRPYRPIRPVNMLLQ